MERLPDKIILVALYFWFSTLLWSGYLFYFLGGFSTLLASSIGIYDITFALPNFLLGFVEKTSRFISYLLGIIFYFFAIIALGVYLNSYIASRYEYIDTLLTNFAKFMLHSTVLFYSLGWLLLLLLFVTMALFKSGQWYYLSGCFILQLILSIILVKSQRLLENTNSAAPVDKEFLLGINIGLFIGISIITLFFGYYRAQEVLKRGHLGKVKYLLSSKPLPAFAGNPKQINNIYMYTFANMQHEDTFELLFVVSLRTVLLFVVRENGTIRYSLLLPRDSVAGITLMPSNFLLSSVNEQDKQLENKQFKNWWCSFYQLLRNPKHLWMRIIKLFKTQIYFALVSRFKQLWYKLRCQESEAEDRL